MPNSLLHIMTCVCNTLRDLVPFVQFKKLEKHPWKSVLVNLHVFQATRLFSQIGLSLALSQMHVFNSSYEK